MGEFVNKYLVVKPAKQEVAVVVHKQSGAYPIAKQDYERIAPVVEKVSAKYSIPPALLHSMITQESEYGNSKAAGNNVMQMTKPAYTEINDAYAKKTYGWTDSPKSDKDIKTQEQGIEAGARYLAVLRDRYGIDLNDSFAVGKRFNGGSSYGKDMQRLTQQFNQYIDERKKPMATTMPTLDVIPKNPYVQPEALPGLNMPVYKRGING